MPSERLYPCPHCSRHVRSSESACPFCRKTVRYGVDAAARAQSARKRREFVALFGTTLLAALSESCRRDTPSTVPLSPEPSPPPPLAPPAAEDESEGWGSSGGEGELWPPPDKPYRGVPMYGAPAPPIDHYVIFEKDSFALGPEAKELLQKLVKSLDDDCSLTIQGHADEFEDNPEKLSKKRAEAVRTELVKLGMRWARLRVDAFGTTRQHDRSVHTYDLNRRVDFVGRTAAGERCRRVD
jgi:outer membrane protein OmpA-like peptidoglycan-associated protein